jgi:hypothetical protein
MTEIGTMAALRLRIRCGSVGDAPEIHYCNGGSA